MLRTILHETGQRILRTITADRIQTLSPPRPESPARSLMPVVESLLRELDNQNSDRDMRKREAMEMAGEMMEAAMMGGSGPWLGPMQFAEATAPGGLQRTSETARESFIGSQGANGLFELELNNWDWRRQINFAWLEFSRWGIQQIILISRLYYIKNPIVRRLVDVCAIYVFGRGVEISSPDEDVNDEIKRFRERNQKVLGQVALTDLERRKDYDGNLFFVAFSDKLNSGETSYRTIDATEIQEIVTDPNDADTEQFFQRIWSERTFDAASGAFKVEQQRAWYPAMNYEPAPKPKTINGDDVMWETPVYHRKCGTVGKWLFGCPRIYPMLDWAKASRKFLEHCAAVKAALAQISTQITTKGGAQALAGIKQQLETTAGTGNSGWPDQNPTAVNGSVFASGTGTTLSAFKSQGEGGNPEEVRQYKLMCCMCKGVPETFLGDVSTGNLATATTLDRPTELAMMSLQEEWREDLVVLTTFALRNAVGAPNGKLREALEARKVDLKTLTIREAKRIQKRDGSFRYVEAEKEEQPDTIEIKVTFPAIREGDGPALVNATVAAMTLNNKGGQVTGIDEKVGVKQLYEDLGIEGGDEITEEQYPDGEYDPNRAIQKLANPIGKAVPSPGGEPQIGPDGKPIQPSVKASPPGVKEAIQRLTEAIAKWK